MSGFHRLADQQSSEVDYFFQTIEMAKSDEEYDLELCTTPPPHAEAEYDSISANDPSSMYTWMMRRSRPRRRYTISQSSSSSFSGYGISSGSNINSIPPAPPSTPTSLTPTSGGVSSNTNHNMVEERLDNLLYILDYAPKYKKKLREQQRIDTELSELFNIVTLKTSSSSASKSSSVKTPTSTSPSTSTSTSTTSSTFLSIGRNTTSVTSKTKVQPDHGVSSHSRNIRKHEPSTTKIFKMRRNIRELLRHPDEDDSVSAPECDTEEEETRFNRLGRIKSSRRFLHSKRQRRFARFEHQERMETMVNIFDEAMSFNNA